MKKLIFLVAFLTIVSGTLHAQDVLESLKSAATAALDKATNGKATAAALVGSWKYTAPAVKLESQSDLAEIAATALTANAKKRLTTVYQYAGIKSGSCKFTFNKDKTFTAVFGKRTAEGTYEYNAETHAITMNFTKNSVWNLGSYTGYAYLSGTNLQLVFGSERLMSMVKTMGTRVASLSSLTQLLSSYNKIDLGFELSK